MRKISTLLGLSVLLILLVLTYQNFSPFNPQPRFTSVADIESYEYLLPLWLDQERIHVHIPQSGYAYEDRDYYFGASQTLKDLGFNAYTRHIKPMSHGPMWPTQIASPQSSFDLKNGQLADERFMAGFLTKPDRLPPDRCLDSDHDDFDSDFDLALRSGNYPYTNCRDLALRAQLSADRAGINMIGYYWLGADEPIRNEFPELSALEPVPEEEWLQNLAPIDHTSIRGIPMQAVDVQQMKHQSPQRAFRLSFETDYKNILVERIKEVAARGIKTLYLDHFHGAQNGDWRFFIDKTPADHPMPHTKDISDQNYRKLLKRFNDNNIDVLDRIMAAGRIYHADFSAITSVSYLPTLFDPRSRSSLAARTPLVKTEFHLPHRQIDFYHRNYFSDRTMPSHSDLLDFGYAILSGSSYGRPFSAWIHDPARNIDPEDVHAWSEPGILSEQQIESAAAFVIGSGGIANLHLPSVQGPDLKYKIDFQDSRYLNVLKYSDSAKKMGRFRPYKWVAVYYSEEARDGLYDEMFTHPKKSLQETYAKAWDELFNPTIRAYQTFRKRGMPVNLITDVQVLNSQLDDYAYIIVPFARNRLPGPLLNNLQAYGNKVIYMEDSFSQSEYKGDFLESDLLVRAPFIQDAPFRTGALDGIRVSYYMNPRGRVIATAYQDIDWLLEKCVDDSPEDLRICRESMAEVTVTDKSFVLFKNLSIHPNLNLNNSSFVSTETRMIPGKERIQIENLGPLGFLEFR